MIFAPILGPSYDKIKKNLLLAKGEVEGVELRIDTFENSEKISELIALAHTYSLKVLAVVRPERQGGLFQGTEESRLVLLEKVAKLGPDFIDLEYDLPHAFFQKISLAHPNLKILSSYHDFEKTEGDLEVLLAKMMSPFVHVYKIAMMTRSSLDALKILQWVVKHRSSHHVIGIGMGEYGQITRILAPIYGNFLSFAALSLEEISAPGQLTLKELEEVYGYRSLNSSTEVYALIGDPVAHSVGHLVHNHCFRALKKNACYVKIPLAPQELHPFLKQVVGLSFRGFSVTAPLKELCFSEVKTESGVFGSVNTLLLDGLHFRGFNTDGVGALDVIEKHLSVRGKKVVILGAGGVARAIGAEAVKRGAHLTLLNRTKEKALALASLLHCAGGGLEELPKVFREGYDLLIQCTSFSESIDPRWIIPGCTVMDTIYVPKETALLKEAAKKGCTLISGLEMFFAQAALQQVIWSGNTLEKEEAARFLKQTRIFL